jgi:hypothetical protein
MALVRWNVPCGHTVAASSTKCNRTRDQCRLPPSQPLDTLRTTRRELTLAKTGIHAAVDGRNGEVCSHGSEQRILISLSMPILHVAIVCLLALCQGLIAHAVIAFQFTLTLTLRTLLLACDNRPLGLLAI